MKIEEYLTAFEEYRNQVLVMEDILKSVDGRREEREEKGSIKKQFKSNSVYTGALMEFADLDKLREEYERRKRILSRATHRLQKAISEIYDVKLSGYLTCRYICGMKNEEIALKFNYCERQIYRLAQKARRELYNKLIFYMPSAKRHREMKIYRYVLPKRRRYRKFSYFNKVLDRRGKK